MSLRIFLLFNLIIISACNKEQPSLVEQKNAIDDISEISSDNFKTEKRKVSRKIYDDKELREIYSKKASFWPKPEIDSDIEHKEIGNIEEIPYPKDNLYTEDKYNLGRLLFSEGKLSKTGGMSCLSCHNPNNYFNDSLQTSIGIDMKPLKRNSPTIINSSHYTSMFWDGRAKTLEEQAKAVLQNPREMDSSEELIIKNLSESPLYKSLFKKAFGDESISLDKTAKAISTFERTIVTKNKSNFDLFIKGKKDALSDSQVRGMHIFRTSGRCINCHNGTNFSDNKFHNIGLVLKDTKYEDLGRVLITNQASDYGVFRTPSLRNIVKTAPYFHNGLLINLKGLINMYSNGMPNSQNKSKHIIPLGLETKEREDLIEFLSSLSEEIVTRK
ncbi:MAG: cytochrome c peroxidase [Cyanobacteriota bacterium]